MKIKYLFLFLAVTSGFIIGQQVRNNNSGIEIKDAWIRASAQGSNTALFFEVMNNSNKPDTLFSAESKIAEVVEIHETYKRENDMMGMRRVNFVVIPPKSAVKFQPRDLHVMLIELKNDLRINDNCEVVLKFKNAGKVKIDAVARDMQMMMNK